MKSEELIEKFIQNSLNREERAEFDLRLAADKDFRNEVAFHANLKKVAEQKDEESFRTLLHNLEEKADAPFQKRFAPWLLAASIIVLLGVGYLFAPKSTDNAQLFASYFEPYRNVTAPVVRGENNNELRNVAFNAYENGDYDTALDSFDTLLDAQEDPILSFYKANALLQLNRTNEAIAILTRDVGVDDMFMERRYWYLGLAYLKADLPEKAIPYLQKLSARSTSAYKKQEAGELLDQLD